MQKSRSDNLSKFYLPSGLATNSQQLKFLQQKLLKNHFANQNYEQSQKSSKGMSNRSQSFGPQAFQKSKQISLRQYDLQAQRSSREFKEALSNDLKQQMRVKNLKKMQQKQQNISHQQTLTRNVGQLDALEKERQKQFNKKFKEEVKEDIKIQQDRRQKQIVEHQQEQVFYKNRYSGNDLIPRTQSLVQLKNSYVNPTKQYYYEVDQALRQRNIVPNPEGQASNSAFKVTRKMQQINKLDFMFAGGDLKNNYQRQRSFYQGLRTEDNRYRSQLRETLIKQIREKEELKKVEKMKDFTKPYTNPEFQQIHHPINNPVDFRIAHDNKYVLGQLRLIQ